MFKGLDKVTDNEFKIIQCIAHSTVPKRMLDLCTIALQAKGIPLDLGLCSKRTGLPRSTCERALEDLTLLRILEKDRVGKLTSTWKIRNEIITLLKGAGLYV